MAIVAALADAAVTPKELLLVVASVVAVVGSRSRGLRTESQFSNTVVVTET